MRGGLLLDSHVFYWLMGSSPMLTAASRRTIAAASVVHVSAVSVAELSIKQARGRLSLPDEFVSEDFASAIDAMKFRDLPLTIGAAARLRTLPLHHGDPFDRLLIAQALDNNLTLVTHDRAFALYDGLDILWT